MKRISASQKSSDALYDEMKKRALFAPEGTCSVELVGAFCRVCAAQSCGKCVPCRIGLARMCDIIDKILNNEGTVEELSLLEKTATALRDSADCAIGFEAGNAVLNALTDCYGDFISHIERNICSAEFSPVPCVGKCPAHVDVPGYIALTLEGRYADAVRLIRKDNPFVGACALVCEHPCESACRRGIIDSPINIRGIKRSAFEAASFPDNEERDTYFVPAPEKNPPTGKRVVIVGAGPCGLSCAYYLSLMGHEVTVFEAREKAGGMLRYGIPQYRLPDVWLDKDINMILSTGVKLETGVEIGENKTLSELRSEFDAVFISIGAHKDKKLRIAGEELNGVVSAIKLLKAPESFDFSGKDVIIIGGGNVAMDALRSARRLGAESVRCVYRRRVEDMTALPEEVEGARAEGCEVSELLVPVKINADENGNVSSLTVKKQIIGGYEKGRPKPYNSSEPEFDIKCDIIVVAIGQDIASLHFEKSGIQTKWGEIGTDIFTSVPSMNGVFAGGDCALGPVSVIRVIEMSKVAARAIDKYLGFNNIIMSDAKIPHPAATPMAPCGRATTSEREAFERQKDFQLMEKGFNREETSQECSRCLRCDRRGLGSLKGGRSLKW